MPPILSPGSHPALYSALSGGNKTSNPSFPVMVNQTDVWYLLLVLTIPQVETSTSVRAEAPEKLAFPQGGNGGGRRQLLPTQTFLARLPDDFMSLVLNLHLLDASQFTGCSTDV